MTYITKTYIRYFLIFIFVFILGLSIQSDDKELFMGLNLGTTDPVKPNVVIIMDSSGSMNTISFYPKKGVDNISNNADDGYDPAVSYSGNVDGFTSSTNYMDDGDDGWYARWIVNGNAERYNTGDLENLNGANNWTGCYAGDGTPNNFQVGGYGNTYFNEGETIIFRDTNGAVNDAIATITRKYTDASDNTWFELENIIGGPITVNGGHFQRAPYTTWKPTIVHLYGNTDDGNDVRYPENYMRWMYIHATDEIRASISHFATYGIFDTSRSPAPEPSSCDTGSGTRIKQTFTRIQTAREVVCQVARDASATVELGLFRFNHDNGSTKLKDIEDMALSPTKLNLYLDSAWNVKGDGWTPLAEALSDVWYYYKPGTSKTRWPVDYELDHSMGSHDVDDPNSPIDYWCQNNYIILMTDGESTKDGFNDSGKYGNSIFKQMPVRRATAWNSWSDGWGDTDANDQYNGRPQNYNPTDSYCPNYTCWLTGSGGTDYLDDVAYFLRHQDMFPDDFYTGWTGEQNIYTYTIGFNADNHMLLQAAVNGDGAYYTASNYEELAKAFQLVITSINLRNFAFSSITAPKKTATATNADQTVSYVGYFMPSQAAAIWEGHLLAFPLVDKWGSDDNNDGVIDPSEYNHDSEEDCLNVSNGKPCYRSIALTLRHEWDAADEIPSIRNLYTHNVTSTLFEFNSSYRDTLKPLFGPTITDAEADQIIDKIRLPQLADIFHSDVGFVGPPPHGKQYVSNIDPTGSGDESFTTFYNNNKNRDKVIYAGTNDGIMHMFYASTDNNRTPGQEVWGFLPDDVLPSLPKIVLDNEHTYTVDGRMTANDIYWVKPGSSTNTWSTILVYGLRDGGHSYYAMDITSISTQPTLLWKFKDATHSGKSWGKPTVGRIKYKDGTDIVDKWVAVLTGGFAFNSENPNSTEGKAIFVVDASNGNLLWMLGYDSVNGAEDTNETSGPEVVNIPTTSSPRKLTKSDDFNFPIPSSLTVIDKDSDGYLDAMYFGNAGGHMFKTDMNSSDVHEWVTTKVYKSIITNKADTRITSIVDDEFEIASSSAFTKGDGIMGETSFATGYIIDIDYGSNEITVVTTSGTFQSGEDIVARDYDPIYHPPAVAFDTCYQLWVAFGTGDRDRPRTNRENGRFVAFLDNNVTNYPNSATLQDITSLFYSPATTISITAPNGWYFDFSLGEGEKIFDPEPIILPDDNLIPHIYFNTYQPPSYSSGATFSNPCDVPNEGVMTIYDIAMVMCGTNMEIVAETDTGRIAGGGIYEGKEYVMYKSQSGDVADVPGGEGGNFIADPKRLPYPGGVLFWKEKKR